jgi:hypothetical protein
MDNFIDATKLSNITTNGYETFEVICKFRINEYIVRQNGNLFLVKIKLDNDEVILEREAEISLKLINGVDIDYVRIIFNKKIAEFKELIKFFKNCGYDKNCLTLDDMKTTEENIKLFLYVLKFL